MMPKALPRFKVPPLTAWSYSRLKQWLDCPLAARYKFVDKIPEPKAPAMERGTAIHLTLQRYVEKKSKAIEVIKVPNRDGKIEKLDVRKTLGELKKPIEELRKGGAACELELAVDARWQPVSWFDKECRVRVKLDAELVTGKKLLVVDHKSGKERPGEHAEQLDLYAPVAFAHHPEVEEIIAEMWYVDIGKRVPAIYTDLKKTMARLRRMWEKKAEPLLKDRTFKATPSVESCRWCNYAGRRGGPCPYGPMK
jgi:PD-(D/E)XK nuclease superfamily